MSPDTARLKMAYAEGVDALIAASRNPRELPHEGTTNEWLTPQYIIDALGPFDLDPCAPSRRPWETARSYWTAVDNGLVKPWHGFVWMNPPYGPNLRAWLAKMAEHDNGIALVFARTETRAFHEFVWGRARGAFMLAGRVKFCYPDGRQAQTNSAASTLLLAYGDAAARRLNACGLDGCYVGFDRAFRLNETPTGRLWESE